MAQYSDYLQYLQHVDDTTLRDIENRENALRCDFNDKITRVQQEMAVAQKELETRYKTEIRKLREETDNLQREHSIILESLKKTHETKLTELKNRYARETNALKEQYQNEIKQLNDEKNSSLQHHILAQKKIKDDYEHRIFDLKQHFANEETAHILEIKKLKDDYEHRISDLKQQFTKEKTNLIAQQQDKIEELNNEIKRWEVGHSSTESNIRASYESQMEALKKRLNQEKNLLESQLLSKIRENERKYSRQLSEQTETLKNERLETYKTISDLRIKITEIENESDLRLKNTVKKITEESEHHLNVLKSENSVLRSKLNGFENDSKYKRLKLLSVIAILLFIITLGWTFFTKTLSTIETTEKIVTLTDTIIVEKSIESSVSNPDELNQLQDKIKFLERQVKEKDAAISKKDASISSLKREIELLNKEFNQ